MFGDFAWGMSPVIDGFRIFLACWLLLPLYVLVDSLRPWRHEAEADFNVPKEGVTGYIWMSGILLLIGLGSYLPSALYLAGLPGVPDMPALISSLALFFMPVLLVVYLKRVVFNNVMRRYRREIKRQKKLAKAGTPVEVAAKDDDTPAETAYMSDSDSKKEPTSDEV